MAKVKFEEAIDAALEVSLNAVETVVLTVALVVFVYNPIAFIIWSIIAPRVSANILAESDELGPFFAVMAKLHKPITHIFPMCMKKHFMYKLGMREYSVRSQLKAFKALGGNYNLKKAAVLINKMSESAVNKLYNDNMKSGKYNKNITEAVIEAGVLLSYQQITDLLCNKGGRDSWLMFKRYAEKKTLPKDVMEILIRGMVNGDESGIVKDVFFNQVEKNGLSPKLLDQVMVITDAPFRQRLNDSVEAFRQRTIVVSGNREAFASMLANRRGLFSQVEKLLKPWQYEMYNKEVNCHMSEEAICDFIARENMEMCALIFKHERLSEKAKLMAKANPKFAMMLNR